MFTGRRPKPIIVAAKDPTGNWQCSSYGSDEQPSAQHQQYVQSFSRSPLPVPALSVSNSLSYGLLHTNNNNNITIQCSHQKRGVHSKERRPALKRYTYPPYIAFKTVALMCAL